MKSGKLQSIVLVFLLGATVPLARAAAFTGAVELRVDDLKAPLGIDDPAPHFSWQLRDLALGAKQTSYQVQVASQAALLDQNKPDVWDSGLVASSGSLNVPYGGSALKPSTRYFWRVQVWDGTGKPYTPSEPSWWETGLLTQDQGNAKWIGYETPEESAMRHAPAAWITSPDAQALAAEKLREQDYAWRTTVALAKPVRFAALYAAGQDTVSAWIDGTQVLAANLLPAWKQMPWKKFVRADVTAQLAPGANSIAIQSVHYVVNPNGLGAEDPPPMIATLVVQYADGSWATFAGSPDWRVAVHPDSGWQQKSFDDSGWKKAIVFAPLPGSTDGPLGHPWTPASQVGAHLRHGVGRLRTFSRRQAGRRRSASRRVGPTIAST
jgi:alpha-L-rhamnosidase